MHLHERLLLAYCVEKLGSCVGRKRRIGNSTVQNGHHGTNASQLGCRHHRKFVIKVAARLFQHNRPIADASVWLSARHCCRYANPAASAISESGRLLLSGQMEGESGRNLKPFKIRWLDGQCVIRAQLLYQVAKSGKARTVTRDQIQPKSAVTTYRLYTRLGRIPSCSPIRYIAM